MEEEEEEEMEAEENRHEEEGKEEKEEDRGGGRQGTVEDSQLQCSFLPQCSEAILAIVFSSAQGEEEKKSEQE